MKIRDTTPIAPEEITIVLMGETEIDWFREILRWASLAAGKNNYTEASRLKLFTLQNRIERITSKDH